MHDRNEIPTSIPMFSRSDDTIKLPRRLSDVRTMEKSKMAAINRKYRYEIAYISASIHNNNEIPTTIPMFSTLENAIRLLRRMVDEWKGEKSKLAAEICVISYLLTVIGR